MEIIGGSGKRIKDSGELLTEAGIEWPVSVPELNLGLIKNKSKSWYPYPPYYTETRVPIPQYSSNLEEFENEPYKDYKPLICHSADFPDPDNLSDYDDDNVVVPEGLDPVYYKKTRRDSVALDRYLAIMRRKRDEAGPEDPSEEELCYAGTGTPMPVSDQAFQLNWATPWTGERRADDYDFGQQQSMSIPAYGGYQGGGSSTKKLQIPNGRVGVIIGKGGETIKNLQHQSGAKIQITRDADADPHAQTRAVDLTGDADQIAKAEQLINEVLSAAEMGGSGQGPRRGHGPSGSGGDQFVMKIQNNKVGLVIGKGGETIKNMQATTGARIQVIPLHLPPGDTSLERTLQIDGTTEQIEAAKLLVFEVTSENSSMGGGYSQQGYQARPQTNWSQQGPPMQQYGYVQPQYQQQPYGAYPNQPTSGGYTANQSSEGSGYDYYNQQPSTQQQPSQPAPGSTDTTGYNYGQQQQATGYTQQSQGYSQDGYSNSGYQAPVPQSGYSQPQSQGYDQQGYNYSYGTQGDTAQAPPTGPPSAVPQQGYTTQQPGQNYGVPPTTLTGYATQQSGYGTGTGYGAPPPTAQKSPAGQSAYGQTQQSPTAQGAYGQPTYPSYAQPDSTTKQSPSSLTTPSAQPGYGVPPSYGASGYAQQAPPYNSGYGGGYAQPPVYSANALS